MLCAGTTSAQLNSSIFGMMEARALGPGSMSGRITAIEGVEKAIATFLPVYALWTIVVVFGFPLFFGFR